MHICDCIDFLPQNIDFCVSVPIDYRITNSYILLILFEITHTYFTWNEKKSITYKYTNKIFRRFGEHMYKSHHGGIFSDAWFIHSSCKNLKKLMLEGKKKKNHDFFIALKTTQPPKTWNYTVWDRNQQWLHGVIIYFLLTYCKICKF